MNSRPHNESVAESDLEVVFSEIVGLAEREALLRAESIETSRQKNERINEVSQWLGQTALSPRAQLMAAVLVHTNDHAAHLRLNWQKILELEHNIQASSGQMSLWLTTELVPAPRNRYGASGLVDNDFLNIGFLAADASLEVNDVGQISVPFQKTVKAEIDGYLPWVEQPFKYVVRRSKPRSGQVGLTMLTPSYSRSLEDLVMLVGDDAVEAAIGAIEEGQRPNFEQMIERLKSRKAFLGLK